MFPGSLVHDDANTIMRNRGANDGSGANDLFIGEHYGNLNYYRNDGTASTPAWTFVTETWFSIDVGTKNIPWFADIDADGDYDLFIGDADVNLVTVLQASGRLARYERDRASRSTVSR